MRKTAYLSLFEANASASCWTASARQFARLAAEGVDAAEAVASLADGGCCGWRTRTSSAWCWSVSARRSRTNGTDDPAVG